MARIRVIAAAAVAGGTAIGAAALVQEARELSNAPIPKARGQEGKAELPPALTRSATGDLIQQQREEVAAKKALAVVVEAPAAAPGSISAIGGYTRFSHAGLALTTTLPFRSPSLRKGSASPLTKLRLVGKEIIAAARMSYLRHLVTLEAGAIVGEVALVSDVPNTRRNATVRSVTSSSCLSWIRSPYLIWTPLH